ncbi:MAG: aminotransferase class V-fold PLP-dependent enzyme [Gemmatimonadetes bacterium]|nr:aminotransferase class V-fold PLP-dependent enzyme [Gemmatimonadota bacterium]
MHLETIAVHAGRRRELTGDVAAAIHLSTTFERGEAGDFPGGYIYTRYANPNRESLEAVLAALEGGAAAAAFASGQAATAALLQTLQPGDHVLAPTDSYFGVRKLLGEFERWGLRSTFVDMTDLDAVRAALRPGTRLVWAETPSNPLLRIVDLEALADLARSAGAALAVDNTWATPVLQRPISLGADIVMHSTTKYIGGHSDVLGGALVFREADERFDAARNAQQSGGAGAAPFDSWLTARGARTLPWRVRAQTASAMELARFLATRTAVRAVHYPGLETHPGHDIAARQMTGFGGMLSFEVRGGRAEAMAVANACRIFTRATSLGGAESLIEHRASVEPPDSGTPEALLRVSVGLEHPDDLIEDLDRALAEGIPSS